MPAWGTVRDFRWVNRERLYCFVFDDGHKAGPFNWSGDDPDQYLGEYARGTLVLPVGAAETALLALSEFRRQAEARRKQKVRARQPSAKPAFR